MQNLLFYLDNVIIMIGKGYSAVLNHSQEKIKNSAIFYSNIENNHLKQTKESRDRYEI